MQADSESDEVPDIAERLHEIVAEMLEPYGKSVARGTGTVLGPRPPFDISKPNQHDSKAEFLRERKTVEESFANINKAVRLFIGRDTGSEEDPMMDRLGPIIDQKLRSNAPREKLDNSIELIRKNVADVGGFSASVYVMIDLLSALQERRLELRDQEQKFWDVPHRAPDPYARIIALRLAKIFARNTGKRPSVGTSGVTGDPSTAYSRALKDVFAVLEISGGTRTRAEWAIDQLTDEDLEPHSMKSGILSGLGLAANQRPSLLDLLTGATKKDTEI